MTDSTAPTRSAFSYRAFTMFWIGRIVSILSFQMLVVAIGWQLYTLTGSALDLGLLGIAQFVPMLRADAARRATSPTATTTASSC